MAFSSVLRTNERQKNPLLTFNFQIMMLKLKSVGRRFIRMPVLVYAVRSTETDFR